MKIEARVQKPGLKLGLPKALDPNCPTLVFRPQTPNVTALGSKIFFTSTSINIAWNKPLFSNFGSFLTKLWEFIPRKLQRKTLQKFSFKFPLCLVLKKPLLWSTKIQNLQNHLIKIKKSAYTEILLLTLRAFEWCRNQIILKRFHFWLTSLTMIQSTNAVCLLLLLPLLLLAKEQAISSRKEYQSNKICLPVFKLYLFQDFLKKVPKMLILLKLIK